MGLHADEPLLTTQNFMVPTFEHTLQRNLTNFFDRGRGESCVCKMRHMHIKSRFKSRCELIDRYDLAGIQTHVVNQRLMQLSHTTTVLVH